MEIDLDMIASNKNIVILTTLKGRYKVRCMHTPRQGQVSRGSDPSIELGDLDCIADQNPKSSSDFTEINGAEKQVGPMSTFCS